MYVLSPVVTIFRMEARKFFLSRKAVLSALLAGPILILFLLLGIPLLSPASGGVIVYGQGIDPVVAEGLTQVVFCGESDNWLADFRSGNASVAVVTQGDEAGIYYDSSVSVSSASLEKAHEIAGNIALLEASPEDFPDFTQQIHRIEAVDISKDSDYLSTFLPFVSMLFMMAMMTFQSCIADHSIDALCGERERGTLDMLLLTGTPISAILLGKAAFLALAGLVILTLDSLAMVLGLGSWLNGTALSLSCLGILLLPLAGISAMTVGLYLLLSACFDRVKLAMSYAGFATLFFSLLSLLPNLVGKESLRFIPIANLPILFSALVRGEYCLGTALGGMAVGFLLSSFLLTVAGIRLSREKS